MKDIILEYKNILDKKTMSVYEIAARHNVSVEQIEAQLELGIETESEHTSIERFAKEIALDHLMEDPEYYTKLIEMEKDD